MILAAVLNIDVGEVARGTSTDTLDVWDSLKHMNLIVALEDEFGITFDQEEIAESTNFDVLVKIVQSKTS